MDKYEAAVKQAGGKPLRWKNSQLEYFFYRNPRLLSRNHLSSLTMEIALSLMTEVCRRGVRVAETVDLLVMATILINSSSLLDGRWQGRVVGRGGHGHCCAGPQAFVEFGGSTAFLS